MRAVLLVMVFGSLSVRAAGVDLDAPDGCEVSLFARVPNARAMAWGDGGTLFVGSRSIGKVHAVLPSGAVKEVASGLNMPTGVAVQGGDLYVAAVDRLLRYPGAEQALAGKKKLTAVEVVKDLPKEEHHGWREIAFGPDGKLYESIGAPCNVCDEPLPFASIIRMNKDGSGREVVAKGVRNSVGLTWHPDTGKLWFTDNGRDWLGDDAPDDELNVVTETGQHFGFPYCLSSGAPDPEFGKGKDCGAYRAPAAPMGPHVAALGLAFGKQAGEGRRELFIAQHGSWNRSTKSGYRVVKAVVEGDKVVKVEPFLTGFLDGQTAKGRPVDVVFNPDGSLLVSDDDRGAIYRVTCR